MVKSEKNHKNCKIVCDSSDEMHLRSQFHEKEIIQGLNVKRIHTP